MNTINDVRQYFISELEAKRFTYDRSSAQTIEMLGASFLADEPAIFGEVNEDYVSSEIAWYETQSTNINTLASIYGKSPVAWQYSANDFGEINSNYGTIIFSEKYFNQFANAVNELICNPDSRRAQMVYNRPSIWKEFDENGKNDFICTNAQTMYIRDGKLHMVSQMRSNDVVFGYKNDYAWARYIMREAIEKYNYAQSNKNNMVVMGDLYWQVMNLHVYGRHFDLVKA